MWESLKNYNDENIGNVANIWTGANAINQVSKVTIIWHASKFDFNILKRNGSIRILEIQFQNGYGVGNQMKMVIVGFLEVVVSKCLILIATIHFYYLCVNV